MAHAYTPGLRVAERTTIVRERLLPIRGEVLAAEGARARAEDVVARTALPGRVHAMNLVNVLGVTPAELPELMLLREGQAVSKGQAIAETRPWLAFLKTTVDSPITGVLESVSSITGQVMLRHPPRTLELKAYIDGKVTHVRPGDGVVIETEAALVQGIFGVGGETSGVIESVADSPGADLDPGRIGPGQRGKVLVGGAHAGREAFEAAREHGVAALVVGAIHDKDLKDLLGRDLGVAITGGETIGFTLIVTEGFGSIPMARRTWELLLARAGQRASANGATQIRAGVLRPEIIVPVPEGRSGEQAGKSWDRGALKEGDTVRVIRAPWFGALGRVKALPNEPRIVESGSTLRVLVAELADGREVVVPRANVELLEE